MCFSAEMSIAVAGALGISGIVSSSIAYRKNRNFFLFALIPLIFAAQQAIEAAVWLHLNSNQENLLLWLGYLYLFFAFFFWPTYFPLSIYKIESNCNRKQIIKVCIVTGLILGLILYIPLLIGIVPLTVFQVHHSINYHNYQSFYFLRGFSLIYCAVLLLPTFFSSQRSINLFGVISAFAFFASYWWLLYAFTSVWCFSEAIISLGIIYIVWLNAKT